MAIIANAARGFLKDHQRYFFLRLMNNCLLNVLYIEFVIHKTGQQQSKDSECVYIK